MTFTEKFNFLMGLTHSNNKSLASAISVDSTMISKYKNGKCEKPRNKQTLRELSIYFAKELKADYQFSALADETGLNYLRQEHKESDVAHIIFEWLNGDVITTDPLILALNKNSSPWQNVHDYKNSPSLPLDGTETHIYYGPQGKYDAIRNFYNYLLELDNPETIYISSENATGWFLSDSVLNRQIQQITLQVIEHGYRICHILESPSADMSFYDNFMHWLPAYLTGKVDVYYYPGVRDHLYRKTLMVYPGVCTLFSSAISLLAEGEITITSSDERAHTIKRQEFNAIKAFCRPAMRTYASHDAIHSLFKTFFQAASDRLQLCRTLSPDTMPIAAILKDLNLEESDLAEEIRTNYNHRELAEAEIFSYPFLDICPLAPKHLIDQGKVPLLFPAILDQEDRRYTRHTYALHLRNILRLMNEYDNYTFIPVDYSEERAFTIYVRGEELGIVVRTQAPSMAFEFTHPDITLHLRHYLEQQAEQAHHRGLNRRMIKARLSEYIKELDQENEE